MEVTTTPMTMNTVATHKLNRNKSIKFTIVLVIISNQLL